LVQTTPAGMGVHTPAMKNCVKSFRLQSANSDYLDPVPSVIVSGAPANKKIGHFRVAYSLLVRPAWAHSCGCKSRRKLITTNEVKRNCMRVTECGEEAWSETASR